MFGGDEKWERTATLNAGKSGTLCSTTPSGQTYQQYMTDTLILTLNDPEVMGKDVFGYKRLKKILDAWGKKYDLYFDALTKKAEADYARVKMDAAMKLICGRQPRLHPVRAAV